MAADAIGFDTRIQADLPQRGGVDRPAPGPARHRQPRLPLPDFPDLPGPCPAAKSSNPRRCARWDSGLGNDRSALKSRLDIEPNNLLDLGEVLRGPGHRGTVGAKVAVAHFFGQKLQKSKKTGTSNWASAHLSERQLIYAANDAHVALRLYRAWLQASPPAN